MGELHICHSNEKEKESHLQEDKRNNIRSREYSDEWVLIANSAK